MGQTHLLWVRGGATLNLTSSLFYRYSASAGDTNALVTLGNLHLSGGYGVDRDVARALDYFKEAAMMGDPAGTSSVAYMHANGWGVEQDNATAIKYYKYDFYFKLLRVAPTKTPFIFQN